MVRLADIVPLINELNPAEREQLLSVLSEPTSIVSTPGVCGGRARVFNTRIPVWILEEYRRQGMSESELLRAYPTLRAADLVQAWAYVDRHRDEIDMAIRDNRVA